MIPPICRLELPGPGNLGKEIQARFLERVTILLPTLLDFVVERKDTDTHGLLYSRNQRLLLPWPWLTWEGIDWSRS